MVSRIRKSFNEEFLKRKICTGCTTKLDNSVKRVKLDQDLEVVTCRCGRKFVYETTTETYTKFEEEKALDKATKIKAKSDN